jgi:hypothetical protein
MSELVEKLREFARGPGCAAFSERTGEMSDVLSAAAARIEALEEGVVAIAQRANETRTGPLAYQETVFAMHAIARALLKPAGQT